MGFVILCGICLFIFVILPWFLDVITPLVKKLENLADDQKRRIKKSLSVFAVLLLVVASAIGGFHVGRNVSLDDYVAKFGNGDVSGHSDYAVGYATGLKTGKILGSRPEIKELVYVTRTGSKYHKAGCQYLRQSEIAIDLSDAKSQGYSACSRCW